MAKVVVLASQGIEPAVGRYDYLIQGDPSVLGLAAAVGSLAIQTDSATPFAQWQKTTTSDFGWSLVVQSANAGAASASGGYRASAYSVPTDGTTDATAALATLTGTTMPQTGGPYALIVGPGESVSLASDVTLAATVQIQSTGGSFKPASGKKLTINAQPTGPGKIFDLSAGGTIYTGRPMQLNPDWFGADKTGAADSSPGVFAAVTALVQGAPFNILTTPGGKVKVGSGTYKLNSLSAFNGQAYSYITIEGEGPSTLFLNGTTSGSPNNASGMFTFYGGGNFATKQLRFKSFRMSGTGSGDATHAILVDQAEDVYFDDIYLENFANEGIVSFTGESALRKVAFTNCHAKNVGVAYNVGAFNLNAQYANMVNCTADGCGVGFENMGHFTSIISSSFMNFTSYGVMLQSTWSGYLDPTSFLQVNTFGGEVIACNFTNSGGRGIVLPDFTGHANTDPVHTSPAHLDGGLGKIVMTGNVFDRVAIPIWGGSDKLGAIECSSNIFSGQYDSGTGSQTSAVSPQGGTWNLHHNTFEKGIGLAWNNLVSYSITGFGPNGCRVQMSDNTVVGKCWGTTGSAIQLFTNDTVENTRWLDSDGSIAAVPTGSMVKIIDGYLNAVCELKTSEWAWTDPTHRISVFNQPTVLPVLGNTLPATFTFKPGDVLVNRGTTQNWFSKKCTVGGTINPTALTMTATGTNGATTFTASATTGLLQGGWVYFPAIPAIAPKQIINYVPGAGGAVTLNAALEATVPGGTAVSWAVPVFVTDRDANTLTIASQATGDLLYASSATAFARLGAGTNGQYLSLTAGVPVWKSADPRYDAGNSSTAATVTWAPDRQKQKITCTAATPVITIAGIPPGGDLVLDVFQDGTASRVPTFAQTGMGSLVWANGNVAPTLTPTPGGISDRYTFDYDGTRCVGYIIAQNT